jgi:Cu2+-exporting ATPase
MAPADGQTALLACRHCGEPLREGAPPGYCCEGCAAAAAWIEGSGLGAYYRLREGPAPRVEAQADLSAWDRADLQAAWVEPVGAGRRATLAVDGMHCAACAWLIDKALRREPGVLEVRANVLTARVRVDYDPAAVPLSVLVRRIAALGYRPSLPGSPAREAQRRRDRRTMLLRLGIAGLGTMQAMMFSEALYLDTTGSMPIATRDAFRWITALLSAPVVFYAGAPFLIGFWNEMKLRSPGMDTLIGSSVLMAWGGSVLETVRDGPEVWFDAAVMFVFFMLIARHFERRARHASASRIDALAGAQPALAWREREGRLEQVPTGELAVGDRLYVHAGQALPADGHLLDAAADLDEALLTGESRPRRRQPGDLLLAGSVLRSGEARLRVAAVGAATVLSTMVRRVEAAQQARPPLLDWAEALSRQAVLATLVLAVLVGGWWLWVDPPQAFPIVLAVLVVTCPCALALAVPTALARANGLLAERGALVLSGEALHRLAGIDCVVFDKTGTLTRGRPTLVGTTAFGGHDAEAARLQAVSLEAGSHHPLARAFGHGPTRPVEARRTVPGQGIEGRIDGRLWRLGQAGFAVPGQADDDGVWLACEGEPVARFEIDDPIREDAAAVVAALAGRYRVHLLSGDAAPRVAAMAATLGLPATQVQARCTPEGKCAAIAALQAEGRRVLMVGDGINDAAALAAADVSVAMANGAPLALRQADVVLSGERLAGVAELLGIAGAARRTIRQNLGWSVGYNVLALPVAAIGAMSPGWAALGMAASSLLVSANAWRLRSPP